MVQQLITVPPFYRWNTFIEGSELGKSEDLPEILVYNKVETGKKFRALICNLLGVTTSRPWDLNLWFVIALETGLHTHWLDLVRVEAEVHVTSSEPCVCPIYLITAAFWRHQRAVGSLHGCHAVPGVLRGSDTCTAQVCVVGGGGRDLCSSRMALTWKYLKLFGLCGEMAGMFSTMGWPNPTAQQEKATFKRACCYFSPP